MLFFIHFTLLQVVDHYIYISKYGNDDNDGTYENPLNSSNFNIIGSKMNQLLPDEECNAHIVFKEGTYFTDGFEILGWTFDRNKIKHLTIEGETDKKVTLYSSNKISGWTKSPYYKNLWSITYPYQINQLFVGDKRANLCRLPKKWKYARLIGYELHEDPTDSSYYLRYFYVQDNCITMLQKMTQNELHESEFIIIYWWYTDVMKIVDFNAEKKYVVTRILKNDEHFEHTISETSYYYIQNAFPAITEPGEYYQNPNGTLYYYPRENEDMNSIDVFTPIEKDEQRILFFNYANDLTIKNLNFYYTDLGINGVNSNNILIYNCEFKHVKTACWLYAAHDSAIDHCFIEDAAGSGLWFAANNFTVQNCIIRNVGIFAPFGKAIDFWSESNNTYILNNDISDGTTTLIIFIMEAMELLMIWHQYFLVFILVVLLLIIIKFMIFMQIIIVEMEFIPIQDQVEQS